MIALVKIDTTVSSYNDAFESKGSIHRYLSNSLVKVGTESNRSFYRKHIKGGFYYFNIKGPRIIIHFYYNLKTRISELSLKSRIRKKLIDSEITIEYLNSYPGWILESNGLVQSFGEEYLELSKCRVH